MPDSYPTKRSAHMFGRPDGGESNAMRDETPRDDAPRDDPLVDEEEDAAAAEAARIGGRSGMEGMDEAARSAAEHGGGESEGFEEAEALLEERATHAGPGSDPLRDAPNVEPEEDPATYGEADEVEPADQ
jgi:hypothetical protein